MKRKGIYKEIEIINKYRREDPELSHLPEYTVDDYLRSLPLSKRKQRMVYERDNFTCQYCKKGYPFIKLVVDHKTPRSKGGTHDMSNLITACSKCNSKKASKTYEEFIYNEKITIST